MKFKGITVGTYISKKPKSEYNGHHRIALTIKE